MKKFNWNQYQASREEVKIRKENFKEGDTVKLTKDMEGEVDMPMGLEGKVRFVDDIGTIHVSWENGRTLGITLEDSCTKEVDTQNITIEDNGLNML